MKTFIKIILVVLLTSLAVRGCFIAWEVWNSVNTSRVEFPEKKKYIEGRDYHYKKPEVETNQPWEWEIFYPSEPVSTQLLTLEELTEQVKLATEETARITK